MCEVAAAVGVWLAGDAGAGPPRSGPALGRAVRVCCEHSAAGGPGVDALAAWIVGEPTLLVGQECGAALAAGVETYFRPARQVDVLPRVGGPLLPAGDLLSAAPAGTIADGGQLRDLRRGRGDL